MIPEVSVIVPVRDGAASLRELFAGLERQTLARERYEVIVVDNASHDDSAAVARAAGAVTLYEPIANRSRARNRGAASARGEVFAFVDADCVPEPEWLERLDGCRHRAPLVAGPVRLTTGEPPTAVERFEVLWRFAQEDWVRLGWAATANLLVHRDAFEAVGGFDPAYPHTAEDADFCIRAGHKGFGLGFCPGAWVTHDAEAGFGQMLRRPFFHGYGASQALRRIGVGQETWREPWPLLSRRAALAQIGVPPGRLAPAEERRMGRLAQAAYAARLAGSVWATVTRAR